MAIENSMLYLGPQFSFFQCKFPFWPLNFYRSKLYISIIQAITKYWSIEILTTYEHMILYLMTFFLRTLAFSFMFQHFYWRSHEIIYFIIVNVLYILFTHLLYTKDYFLLFEVCHPSTVWHLRLVLLFLNSEHNKRKQSKETQQKWVIDWLYPAIKWSRYQEPKTHGFQHVSMCIDVLWWKRSRKLMSMYMKDWLSNCILRSHKCHDLWSIFSMYVPLCGIWFSAILCFFLLRFVFLNQRII